MRTEFKCEYCGIDFRPSWFEQRFCTKAHAEEFYKAERKDALAHFRAQGLRPDVPATRLAAAE